MKPRTKNEKAVAEISASLSQEWNEMTASAQNVAQQVMDQAKPHVWIWYARKKGKQMWCSDCGHVFDTMPRNKKGEVVCPHCGQVLRSYRLNNSGRQTMLDYDYVIHAEVRGDYQVLRYFLVYYRMNAGKPISIGTIDEVVRRWYKVGELPVVESVGKRAFSQFSNQPFSVGGEMSIKREGDGCWGSSYRIDTSAITSDSRWLKAWQLDGFHGESTLRRLKLEAYDAYQVFSNPHCVTLLKLGWTKLLTKFVGGYRPRNIEKYWPSIRIALRNGYKTANTDADMWVDHLDLIGNERFHKDLRNPVFVCPANLRAEHQRFLDIEQREIERENRERERREMVKEWESIRDDSKLNEDYVKYHKKYFGLCIMCGDIEIRPLQSVAEFFDEGMHMHHCVFRMGYYKRHDALILSARLAGQRVETIEIDLKRGEIVQSRGVCNEPTEHHKAIVATMRAEMDNILALGKAKSKKTKKVAVAA